MKSLLGLVQSAPCRIDIEFKDAEGKPYKQTTSNKTKKEETEEVPVYTNKDSIMGEIRITPLTTKKVEHQGIKIQLLGQIELASERGTAHEFVSMVRELAVPGELTSSKVYPFDFKSVELQYDSFRGQQVRCRYLLRVTVTGKGMTPDAKRDFNIWVINYELPNEAAAPIKMEVGIEDCLHIEFEYDRARYHLQDVVVGRIYFLLVRIKLKHMEIEIRRKETTGAGTAAHSESETLAKYEIMDGAPVRGESVPIRLYLAPYDLAPTYKEVHNKFSVRYFLNLVLVDEEDRRYFKQQEITLFRLPPNRLAAASGKPAGLGATPGPPKLMSYTTHLTPTSTQGNGKLPSPPAAAAAAASGAGAGASSSEGGTQAQPAAAAAPQQEAPAQAATPGPSAGPPLSTQAAQGDESPAPAAASAPTPAPVSLQQPAAPAAPPLPVSTTESAAPAASSEAAASPLQAGEKAADAAGTAATGQGEAGLVFGDSDSKADGFL